MDKKLKCPECGHDSFKCEATIKAVLTTKYDSKGNLDYELQQWDEVESIESFECQNCDFEFLGDEKEFLESLETTSSTVVD